MFNLNVDFTVGNVYLLFCLTPGKVATKNQLKGETANFKPIYQNRSIFFDRHEDFLLTLSNHSDFCLKRVMVGMSNKSVVCNKVFMKQLCNDKYAIENIQHYNQHFTISIIKLPCVNRFNIMNFYISESIEFMMILKC